MGAKIGYLSNIRFPSERAHSAQIAHMCQAFIDNGAEVELIVNTRQSETKQEIDSLFKIDSKFKIIRLPYGIFSAKYKFAFYFSELWFTFAFIFQKGTRKYDILLSRSQIILWTLLFFTTPKKIVWESHDGHINFFSRSILKRGVKAVVTSVAQRQLFELYSKNILLAPNAVDQSFFEPTASKDEARHQLGLPLDKKVVMYIGGFDAWKGVHSLFEVSQFDTQYQIVVIGGKDTEVLELKKQYPNALFLGQRPYSELKDHQQAADVLVVPNTAKNEMSEKFTSPLKLFAHMTSGIPLVLSDIESIKNVVPQELATYFTPDDSSHLKTVLDQVFAEYADKMASATQLQVLSKKFTWENRAKTIIDFIDKKHEIPT